MTGLTLGTGGAVVTPAASAINVAAGADAPSVDERRGTRDDGRGKHYGKGTGIKGKQPKGTPVPCDAEALIAAITLANARGGATLDLAKDCTYLLTTNLDGAGLPTITTPITLNGGKHTTIERAAAADQFRILTINVGGDLTLNNLKVTGGQTIGDGGAILVNPGGRLTTNDSAITRNIADGNGGGIANNGTTHINHSSVDDNRAAVFGGGIVSVGVLKIRKTHVRANTAFIGAGVFGAVEVQIDSSTINANHASFGSGGLVIFIGIGTVADTRITNNTAMEVGGILANLDTQLTLKSVTVAENVATTTLVGGLGTNPGSSVVVENSNIENNTAATDAGGIYNTGSLVLRRTKVTGNQAGDEGGGIYNTFGGAVSLFDTKVVKNIAATDGGGVFNVINGTVELNTATGTIVVKNRPNNCFGVPGCAG
ncbi:right-handed parallel beta-helix repeat-containing protein [Salinispora sp. H7-4]|uniref:right-handed parallel beta-helix repeat-containing protein n=1 Tax=Salinispora sp. H7-4 TaxID=2748321 RepID=UPI0035CB1C3E